MFPPYISSEEFLEFEKSILCFLKLSASILEIGGGGAFGCSLCHIRQSSEKVKVCLLLAEVISNWRCVALRWAAPPPDGGTTPHIVVLIVTVLILIEIDGPVHTS